MILPNGRNDEEALSRLLRVYRDVSPDPDASPNFMPQLWQRIESRRGSPFFLGRLAGGFVTAALALAMGMAVFLFIPHGLNSPFISESYVEALAASHGDNADFFERVHLDEAAQIDEL